MQITAKQEIVRNGDFQGGPVGNTLVSSGFDPGMMRPFWDENGRSCVRVRTGRVVPFQRDGKIVTNKAGETIEVPETEKISTADLLLNHGVTSIVHNATVLTVRQWVTLTTVVQTAFRQRLRAWTDLEAAVPYGGFNGYETLALEYQTMSDPGEATMDFDGLSQGRGDQPVFGLAGLPMPITHCDFNFGDRTLAISRARGGTPINTRMAEAAGRRVAEMVEKTLIGTVTGPVLGSAVTGIAGNAYQLNAGGVYGYLTHPNRNIKTNITAPTTGGWVGKTLVNEILAAMEQMRGDGVYGPFMVYTSTDWDQYLDGDYLLNSTATSNPTTTIRERVKEISEITDIRRLDYLDSATNPFTMVIVAMTSDKIQAVTGMDIQTLQWPTMGGAQINFKVMCIKVPLIYTDHDGNCGVLQATTS